MVIENMKFLLALEMLCAHCTVFRSFIHPDYLIQTSDLQEHKPMKVRVVTSDDHSTLNSFDRIPIRLARVVVKILDVRP